MGIFFVKKKQKLNNHKTYKYTAQIQIKKHFLTHRFLMFIYCSNIFLTMIMLPSKRKDDTGLSEQLNYSEILLIF